MASGVFTPYVTGAEFFGAKPTWIPDELDVQRIQSYQTYEQMYWNVPDIFKVSLRGTNDQPIYIPSTRTIIDTTRRYVAPGFGVATGDRVTGKATTDSAAALLALTDLFRRERFKSKFAGFKKYGLIRGDSVWHVTGDLNKPIGSRLTITSLDPGMLFPITDPDDVDKVIGVHLVEQISTDEGDRIRRLTYRKVPLSNGTNQITVEDAIFELDKWSGPEAAPAQIITPPTALPAQITQIPVYHWRNMEEPGNPFGSSEVRGLERIMGAVNQTVSDESLSLALAGVGMYATDASQPIDPQTKKPVPWKLGPGRVVHHDGSHFTRLPGAEKLAESYGVHYSRLWEALKNASSTPDVAIGKVDVQVAQSGIALAIQLGPMLAKAGEKSDDLVDLHNQMMHDLVQMWFPAYEQTTFTDVRVDCVFGDAVPVDREKRFSELNEMLDRGVIDTEYYRTEAKKLGYVFPEDIATKATAEWERRQAMSDGFADRVEDELGGGEGGVA